ncbi:hypothetical protein, partial [Paenibacillus sp. Soil522]|uniref:hypothetical protein n=1 Tax=Paenibacillus sp. Soil522 TaxID=1736388 RepID=UPI001F34EA25
AFFAYPEGFARQLLLVVQFSKSNLFFHLVRLFCLSSACFSRPELEYTMHQPSIASLFLK